MTIIGNIMSSRSADEAHVIQLKAPVNERIDNL